MLGKRKERDTDSAPTTTTVPHGSTLFVSNLPYTATSTDLQTLFSDIAPVRSAFVVTEHGTGVSKGVGYVAFAIKEDAQSAFETISKDGITLAGRKLRVQWAENKPTVKREKGEIGEKEAQPRPPPKPQHSKLPNDPLAIRTIIVSGLPASIDSKTLWKKIRKYEGAERVEWPIKAPTGGDDTSTAHVLFTSPASASEAVTKLHAHVFKGSLLSVTLKKRLDTLSKPATRKAGQTTSGLDDTTTAIAAPNRSSRLIVRNLPFDITEQDLRAVFLPYGPIHSIHIPVDGDKDDAAEDGPSLKKKARSKGFAFVWMLSKTDAEKVIEGCNGMAVQAGTAESLISDKQKRKKQKRLEKKSKAVVKGGGEGEEGGEGEGEGEAKQEKEVGDETGATERVIAVDWALSKERWKEEKAKIEEEQEHDEDIEMGNVSGSEGSEDDDDESENDDEEEENLGLHEEGSDDEDDDESGSNEDIDRDEDIEEPVKPTLPLPETGTTLFIRNVPFNATEDELRTLFRAFGPLRYARITIDYASGRSRGTGFACFWNLEDADKVVAQSELLKLETTGSFAPVKKNPFTMPSILTPDPSSTLAQSLVLHGRTLDVVRAVTRDEAGKLKEAGEKAREKADKRNVYLLREGVILPNSPAAKNLTPSEIERRTASFNSRRALLKSNPSLFISKTRLSIRQIPIYVTDRVIKRLAIHAVRAFEAEVKRGERQALSVSELAADVDAMDDDKDKEEDGKKGKKKATKEKSGRRTGVKQAKIVRQMERVDPITGKGRSKGYGFLEMNTHADALRVLRWANNHPGVGALFEEWWKDELRDLVKVQEKANAKDEKDEARLRRLKKELEMLESADVAAVGKRKNRGTLIAEFSIENVQVVQRRAALLRKALLEDKKPVAKEKAEKMTVTEATKKTVMEEPLMKKRRVSKGTEEKPQEKVEEVKQSLGKNPIGAIIGRKRKERKMGKFGR